MRKNLGNKIMIVVDFGKEPIIESIASCVPVVTASRTDAKENWISSCSNPMEELDSGADKIIVKNLNDPRLLGIPKDRIVLDSCETGSGDFSFLITSLEFANVLSYADKKSLLIRCNSIQEAESALSLGFGCLVNGCLFKNDPKMLIFTKLFLHSATSDRADGLFPTIVVDEQKVCLGLCYSSAESIAESLATMTGVYQSRKRGLWYKGATSGAVQALKGIDWDCDKDTLCFTVSQKTPGFCHLNTRTCFGQSQGISGLYQTLLSRKDENAPEKSYTKRLFNDQKLLHSKLAEEAEELITASSKDDIAWEAADLIYFVMVKLVASGVSLEDMESHLNKRSKKIIRRPGNAKVPLEKSDSKITISSVASLTRLSTPVVSSETEGVPTDLKTYQMQVHSISKLSEAETKKLLLRPIIDTDKITQIVKPIMKNVRENGDKAVFDYTKQFDKADMESLIIKAPFPEELMNIDECTKQAIDLAYSNIEKFHSCQLESQPLVVETMPGVTCSRFARPIEKVGLYIPGGTAVLPSSTLMLGIPAKVAGCKTIVIATPPRADGTIAKEVVYVAHKVGATMILKAGGAQAVAAMAYGTESVPKVDKICGPGNQYVTCAKMLAQSDSTALLSIDMPAGPSELLVIVDETSNPEYAISDLLSQAEHGVDSQVVLVGVKLSPEMVDQYQNELIKQASKLPRRDIVKVSLSKSFILLVDSMEQAIGFSNDYAPEHLILNFDGAEAQLSNVMNAGSVFVGQYSPESCGDYASGTNHTLPTYGYSRMYSGVNTDTFLKHITSQTLTRDGLDAIGDCVTTLATLEGLEAHRNAVAVRLKDIRSASLSWNKEDKDLF